MRIAITGGTGFVGRHLARSLVAKGHEVILIARGVDDRDSSVRDLPSTRWFSSDLSSASELARAFALCGAVAHVRALIVKLVNKPTSACTKREPAMSSKPPAWRASAR